MVLNFLSIHTDAIIELVLVVVVIFVSFKSVDLFNKNLQEKVLVKHSDTTILGFMPIVDKVLKFVIVFVALATVLQSHGFSITSLIAGFGITGLAVGLGAQITIANIFGSFALLSDKAYKIGDYIIINQTVHDKAVEGIVEDINLRSTKIRTTDGGLIIVPNNIVANGVVKNVSQIANSHETSPEPYQKA